MIEENTGIIHSEFLLFCLAGSGSYQKIPAPTDSTTLAVSGGICYANALALLSPAVLWSQSVFLPAPALLNKKVNFQLF